METTLDKFDFLMSVLDGWKVNTSDREKNAGAFSFLEEGIYIRDIVVSPNYRQTMPGLKTFFATEVLGIYYSKSKSKVTYKEIREYLADNKAKKYNFSFEELDRCFDREANRDAFLTDSYIMKEKSDLRDEVGGCDEWMPYILLDKICETAWRKLRQYYALCEKKCCDTCERKEHLYFQFAQSVALLEIFFCECISSHLNEFMQTGMEKLQELEQETRQIQGSGKQMSEVNELVESFSTFINQLLDKKIPELEKTMQPILAFKLLEAEFAVHLCALLNLLMIFEAVNVCDADYRKENQIGFRLREELYNRVERNFSVFIDRNRNRKKHYLRVNEHLEEVLSKYADKQYHVVNLTVDFLEELEKPERNRDKDKLRELCCMLAYPIYKELLSQGN